VAAALFSYEINNLSFRKQSPFRSLFLKTLDFAKELQTGGRGRVYFQFITQRRGGAEDAKGRGEGGFVSGIIVEQDES
jgi:hypothetical protein